MKKDAGTGQVHRCRGGTGFSLIELLVVVVMITVLAGIIMGTSAYVNQKLGRGRAIRDINQIKNALAEFHSVYGIYPPVNSDNACLDIRGNRRHTMDFEFKRSDPWANPGNKNYATGLVWYLVNDEDPNRGKWYHFVREVMPDVPWPPTHSNKTSGGWVVWTNNLWTCLDPWDRRYEYQCYPPYQSYQLYSLGPDGGITNDDIGRGWNE